MPRAGERTCSDRWLDELAALGYRDRDKPIQLALDAARPRWTATPPPPRCSHDSARRRSAWNAADVRGEVEQLLAREHFVADVAVRDELAEDLTARALGLCVPLRETDAAPEHVRALTSRHVLDVEADLVAAPRRARAAARETRASRASTSVRTRHGQRAASPHSTGDAALVVIEGAAGAGKTTTLAAARDALTEQKASTGGRHTDA